jgi:hypothetical protein
MIITNMICAYHDIKEGSMELACDGLSALNKAFPHQKTLNVQDVSIHAYIPHVLVAFVEGALQGLFDERPDEYVGDTKRPNAGEYVRHPGPTFEGAVPHQ